MNDWQNKHFSVLGDSISTLVDFSYPRGAVYYNDGRKFETGVFVPEDTWWGQVISRLGGRLLVNDSFSGSTVAKGPYCFTESYGCSDERTAYLHKGDAQPDVIMVFMGCNDRGHGVKPAATEAGEQSDPCVFASAYAIMLEKLRKNYPLAEIWCMTLPISMRSNNEHYTFTYAYGGVHITQYCNAIRACAEQYGCRVIDLYAQTAKTPYDTVDGIHANASGMHTLANAVLAELHV